MDLANKLKDLRYHAGHTRGYGRALTQAEVVAAIRQEIGGSISQGYLSQLERGRRAHLTQKSRDQLARFFRVHPGYLVSDPDHTAHNAWFLPPHHPQAHRAIARLAVHPQRVPIWSLLDTVLDLTEEDLYALRCWLDEHVKGDAALPAGEALLGAL